MLQLVRSQQACIERVRSAVRWARRLVVMTGASGQGKSTVIEALILASTVNPLLLHGELLSDRTDAILRLIGLAGLRPEGTDLEMLVRLQNKHQAGTEQGIPEIIVDDSHRLPDDVLRLFQELSAGAYGRQWSVLLVGEDGLVSRLLALKPKPTLSSTVLLPRWDRHDLEDACAALHPGLEIAASAPQLLQQFAMHPRQLLRAASGDGRTKHSDLEAVHQRRDSVPHSVNSSVTIGLSLVIAVCVAIFILMQIDNDHVIQSKPTMIPLAPNKQ